MSQYELCAIVYFAVAIGVAVWTWFHNTQVHYVYGETPSGCMTGLLWPLVLLVTGVCWTWIAIKELTRP